MALPDILRNTLTLPVIGSPLFLVSQPALVIAQCTAGVLGSFPALNARPPEALDQWLTQISGALREHQRLHPERRTAPFAVNQIVHRSNDRLERDIETCVRHRVPIIITSLGARNDINEAVHSYGGLVLHDVTTDAFARKAIDKGADGLIAVAAGAGGHAGTVSPFALIREIRQWFDGPLALSGAIAHGRSILAAEALGADLAYVGSAFLATDEAHATDAYKQMIVDSRAADIVYTDTFSGVHANYLRGSIEAAGLDPAALGRSDRSTMDFGSHTEGLPKTWGPRGATAWRDIWGAGHGIGAVDAVLPTADLVERLIREYQQARSQLTSTPS